MIINARSTTITMNDQCKATGELQGLRVVVTRAEGRAGTLAERLRQRGAEPLLYATISHGPPADPAGLDAALLRLASGAFDWVVFTSVTAVEYVAHKIEHATRDKAIDSFVLGSQFSVLNAAAVGPTTAAACRELLGLESALVPERFTADALAAAFGDLHGQRVLLPNAEIAKPALEQQLRTAGALVERVIAYRTLPASGDGIDLPGLLATGQIDVLTFTSGSTARYFVERIGPAALANANRCCIACIGPSTAEAARSVGLQPTIVAAVSTEEGLVESIVVYMKAQLTADCAD
jgi:uroporphyrinogen-III synthase